MKSPMNEPFSALYLHIPFCRSKCIYCDFDSSPLGRAGMESVMGDYVRALCASIDRFGEQGLLSSVETVYIGGGTPSVLGDALVGVVERVRTWCVPREFTCEANPESFSRDLAEALRGAGVTRVSLGVQSLDDEELKTIGRRHDSTRAREAIALAKAVGFDVSVDLMCGLPGQTFDSWERTLAGAVAEGVDHVSVYPLTVEKGTPLDRLCSKGRLSEPDEDFQAKCMERARYVFVDSGLYPYEVASYARRGKRCRHNIAYWTGAPYLGLGRSAAGMFSAADASLLADLMPGLEGKVPSRAARVRTVQRDDAGELVEFEFLIAAEAAAEDLMLGCRLTDGMTAARIRELAAPLGFDRVADVCDRAVALGLAEWRTAAGGPAADVPARMALTRADLSLLPTHRGWLEGNVLFELFWELV